jgi:hypothetical protein
MFTYIESQQTQILSRKYLHNQDTQSFIKSVKLVF